MRKDAASRLTVGLKLRWQLFNALTRITDRATTPSDIVPANVNAKPSLWIFVSTIGELHATAPFLNTLIDNASAEGKEIVLLTDRDGYAESYQSLFPHAHVVRVTGSQHQAKELAAHFRPTLFVIAEIPCWPSDAPCRLPFGFLYEAKRLGAGTALINGWIYGYPTSCRADAIERRLFQRDWLRLIDVVCAQNERVAHALRDAGAHLVHITGNIKFDALDTLPRPLENTRSPRMLQAIRSSGRPTIVAGCVTEADERDLVLAAFESIVRAVPRALLVLAPRHPENPGVMQSLRERLGASGMNFVLRSESGDQELNENVTVLVLDTMGELRDFYAVASIAHVGRDHNILEPLAYACPVSVRPAWNSTYPSFPVYELTRDGGLVIESDDPQMLGSRWQALLTDAALRNGHTKGIRTLLDHAQGATERTWSALQGIASATRGQG
ncbi:3-deoxy-D-manno-octulosonic acid transferase [Niveibacterium sp.]|uniref:3-deoxy-D-manno-octulosonic acid transferase n=1 Tax=Niveibacterium sp. TaxID=2017444 RepID=UPI0035B01BAD